MNKEHKADKAIESFEKVCESKQAKQKHKAEACEWLSQLYSGGAYIGDRKATELQDDEKKIRYATMACDFGSAVSCASLGFYYKEGSGVSVDLDKTTSYYTKACELQPKLYCNTLGVHYEFTIKDIESALSTYKKACQQDKMWCANYDRLRKNVE